ncbi:sugar transporter domain-containing protein [Trichoderma breve]|uniref:Sugar transporter domain-containing protein n=1 Tax=Trichoderma breve TaxID=2034170 RepID=A0A9W9E4N3_9HYPO|nr:sugar transporter domain-containing protein [Trichoderma breve]KAJ4858034.1 sugar transporter domain-containing protein [Trichoderma breve]
MAGKNNEPINAVHHEKTDENEAIPQVIGITNAFDQAMAQEPPRIFERGQMMTIGVSLVGFCCSTASGYDASLINNLLQNPWFRETYNVESSGIWAGIVASMMQVGGVAAMPFIGPTMDYFGRRSGLFLGALSIIIGTIIQGTSTSACQFMGGRFFIGFGAIMNGASGPIYVLEINHPAYRSVMGALYNTLYFSGAIIAAGAARGGLNIGGNASWRLITWLQCLFAGIIIVLSPWIPESPRWLYVHNKGEKAVAVLAKYHGRGNSESPWVKLQLQEYEEFLNLDGSDKRWWDYRALFHTRASVYRLCCNLWVSVAAQWAGNSVLSYFLGAVLETAGYSDPIQQANITLINNCQQWAFAILGACYVERVGRRPLLMFAFIGCSITWAVGTNVAASKASLGLIFIFGSIFSIGITPLQSLYPMEVLSYEMRAKGSALSTLVISAAMLLNQFAWPVAIRNITWKTYIIFAVWNMVQAATIYFFIPETKNRTLEELDEVFEAANPVKVSLANRAVMVNNEDHFIAGSDA